MDGEEVLGRIWKRLRWLRWSRWLCFVWLWLDLRLGFLVRCEIRGNWYLGRSGMGRWMNEWMNEWTNYNLIDRLIKGWMNDLWLWLWYEYSCHGYLRDLKNIGGVIKPIPMRYHVSFPCKIDCFYMLDWSSPHFTRPIWNSDIGLVTLKTSKYTSASMAFWTFVSDIRAWNGFQAMFHSFDSKLWRLIEVGQICWLITEDALVVTTALAQKQIE